MAILGAALPGRQSKMILPFQKNSNHLPVSDSFINSKISYRAWFTTSFTHLATLFALS
jgi:hypothetical protein